MGNNPKIYGTNNQMIMKIPAYDISRICGALVVDIWELPAIRKKIEITINENSNTNK